MVSWSGEVEATLSVLLLTRFSREADFEPMGSSGLPAIDLSGVTLQSLATTELC